VSIAYIGLGSNLAEPRQQLNRARRALAALPATTVLADSGLFRSPAMTLPDSPPQPDYLNAVIKLRTELSPRDLLHALRDIELAQGRQRHTRWAARTLDLDILLYDALQMDTADLTIPHPGLAQRDFVLYPLQAIDKNMNIPGLGAVSALIARLPSGQLEYLGRFDD
jgi:2-amino-4-hydroxy-6-hydroxymethyldihydropteridine diphosphokinase